MSDIIEISDLNINSELPSANFGAGIELLMNEKRKDTSNSNDDDNISIADLDTLENELNGFSDMKINIADTSIVDDEDRGVSFDKNTKGISFEKVEIKPDIVSESRENFKSENKTWDGYGKFNDIPLNPNLNNSSEPKLTKEEMLKEKFLLLKKLETLEHKGVQLTKKYGMESNFQEMKGEYETIMAEKEKENSVKFQGNMLSAMINGIEFLNGRFDPFDIKLDGWGEQFQENITDYDEIFGELHDKYKSSAKMSPEIKLIFQLGASAMMVHMTNTMFKSAMPGMDDIMRQNPDLAQQFTRAAVDSMAPKNPGFSGFMNNIMREEPTVVNTGPPPAPVETQGRNAIPAPARPGYVERSPFANRPDLQATKGIELSDNMGSAKKSPAIRSVRREMKGPDNIDNILGGLKTKSISMPQSAPVPKPTSSPTNEILDNEPDEKGSTISITELKEMQKDNITKPSKSKRRNGSNKNIVSLDI